MYLTDNLRQLEERVQVGVGTGPEKKVGEGDWVTRCMKETGQVKYSMINLHDRAGTFAGLGIFGSCSIMLKTVIQIIYVIVTLRKAKSPSPLYFEGS